MTGTPQPACWPPAPSPLLQATVTAAVRESVEPFARQHLRADELALTLVDLSSTDRPTWASHRGQIQVYPASVIKLFFLVAAHQALEDGQRPQTPDLLRALHDMIVRSSNDATHYVVDWLTDTTSGLELPPDELDTWFSKRNAISRYFAARGYRDVNANQKPWANGPYGREQQARQTYEPNRNWLTSDTTARLLTEIVSGRAVSAERSASMMALLRRDPFVATTPPDVQARFVGSALPRGAKLWSKAGWTSQVRHDAAYVELPTGRRIVLVIFTERHAQERDLLPAIARRVLDGILNTGN